MCACASVCAHVCVCVCVCMLYVCQFMFQAVSTWRRERHRIGHWTSAGSAAECGVVRLQITHPSACSCALQRCAQVSCAVREDSTAYHGLTASIAMLCPLFALSRHIHRHGWLTAWSHSSAVMETMDSRKGSLMCQSWFPGILILDQPDFITHHAHAAVPVPE